ncbi:MULTISPECIES: glycine cleavage system protein R [Deefgea]|uniref:Glycine cleavage system protein R n=1 Tax=Deefgea piscis TaxID=2739061 RepID=A0A6M8SMT6_9NEIS|nr:MULTISPECIES: ACT domain-containing protein [Deefgea]MBM5574575.1 glycine cleavage system protein R [Deefgea sp. CFH1-16]QKJ66532.1 glycine cleavage system protein R [Deefgea piscis]
MNNVLIVSVIGPDRSGLVEQLAATIAAKNGNWLESSFSRLAGQFSGIVKVAVIGAGEEVLLALQQIAGLDIRGVLDVEREETALVSQSVALSLIGHDRVGIVKDVATILARFAVNIEKLETWLSSGAMSGEMMFHAQLILSAPLDVDLDQVHRQLECIADDLMVEWAD